MFKKVFSLMLLAGVFSLSATAGDTKIGIVDFTRAINETNEGRAAQSRLDSMVNGKKAELEQMEANLQAMATEYQEKAQPKCGSQAGLRAARTKARWSFSKPLRSMSSKCRRSMFR